MICYLEKVFYLASMPLQNCVLLLDHTKRMLHWHLCPNHCAEKLCLDFRNSDPMEDSLEILVSLWDRTRAHSMLHSESADKDTPAIFTAKNRVTAAHLSDFPLGRTLHPYFPATEDDRRDR